MEREKATELERIFFDGHCGMCHRFVRFVLARDAAGLFRFAPLDSDAFRAAVPEARRTNLGDSLVVLTAENRLLTRSTAVLYVARRLGGFWQLPAVIIDFIPAAARDWLYDRIARIRHRLFRAPAQACPVVPEHLRQRFEA